jgi:hypothetical protein
MTNDEIIISPDLSPLYTNPRGAFPPKPPLSSRQNEWKKVTGNMAPLSESGGKRESPNFHGTGEGATNGVELRKASQNVRKSGRSCGGSLIDLNKCSGHDDTTLLFKRVRTVDVTTSFNERYRVWKILHRRVAQLMQVTSSRVAKGLWPANNVMQSNA